MNIIWHHLSTHLVIHFIPDGITFFSSNWRYNLMSRCLFSMGDNTFGTLKGSVSPTPPGKSVMARLPRTAPVRCPVAPVRCPVAPVRCPGKTPLSDLTPAPVKLCGKVTPLFELIYLEHMKSSLLPCHTIQDLCRAVFVLWSF